MSKDPLRANLHYKGYTAKDILARAPSRGLIYSGNRTFAFVDKLLIRTTDTFPSKCSFCQCNFIYTEGFFSGSMMSMHVAIFFVLQFVSIPECYII